ncbi:MAG TPA: DUF3618 domain-containing protein [Polyangiaceae bacterium]|nr:DUF3618 domain-containing protein [Polyangiaceae bacterium]
MTAHPPPNANTPSGTDPKDNGPTAQIEADIDQTRSAIAGDLRTLGERLSPENLKQEAKEVMHEAKNVASEALHEAKNMATSTYREVKEDALGTVSAKVDEFRDDVRSMEREAVSFVRDNAVPLALIGIGAAWLLSSRSRSRRWDGEYRPRGNGSWRYPEAEGRHRFDDVRDGYARAAGSTREFGQRVRERARDWVDGAEHEVQQRGEQVRDFAEHELDQVRGAARDAQERLSHATSRARDAAGRELRHARDISRNSVESHPLAVAAAAAAAGVCVGLLLPETQREDELFGAQRERLVGDAKRALRETQDAARDMTHTAKETARDVKSTLSGATG